MPAKFNKEKCEHKKTIKKAITISPQERVSAAAIKLSLPDVVLVNLCIYCWEVNPKREQNESEL